MLTNLKIFGRLRRLSLSSSNSYIYIYMIIVMCIWNTGYSFASGVPPIYGVTPIVNTGEGVNPAKQWCSFLECEEYASFATEKAYMSASAPCPNYITKVKCLDPDANPPQFEICVSAASSGECTPQWTILRNNQVIASASGQTACMTVTGTGGIEVKLVCGDFVCSNFVHQLTCESYCDKWLFNLTPSGCKLVAYFAQPSCDVEIDDIVINWGDGTISEFDDTWSANTVHTYSMSGTFEVCLTWSDNCMDCNIEGIQEQGSGDRCYHTCCQTVDITCDPCDEVNISLCEPYPDGKACCDEVLVNHPYEGVTSYNWHITVNSTGEEVITTTTSEPSVHYLFIDNREYKVCVSFLANGKLIECCKVITPPCDPCGDLDIEECSDLNLGPDFDESDCCRRLIFSHSLEDLAVSYDWEITALNSNLKHPPPPFYATTDQRYLEHKFRGTGMFKICITVTIEDNRTFECCFTKTFFPDTCECCSTSADFNLFYTNPFTCIKSAIQPDPNCPPPSNPDIHHVWIYSDGTIYRGYKPPPYFFTDFISDGKVCITHEVYCKDDLIDYYSDCLPYPEGAHIGVSGAQVKLTDLVRNHLVGSDFEFVQDETIHELLDRATAAGIPIFIEQGVNLIINEDAIFQGGTWNMGQGTTITDDRHLFQLEGTLIQSAQRYNSSFECCRWTGIIAKAGSTLNWYSAKIHDADTMLILPTSGAQLTHLDITDCTFLENKQCIYWEDQHGVIHNFYNNKIKNPDNCNQVCGCCYSTAITLDNVSYGVSFPHNVEQPHNLIYGYSHGFDVFNTKLKVRNFLLQNLRVSAQGLERGTGIYFVRDVSAYKYLNMDYMWFDNMKISVDMELSGGGQVLLRADASQDKASITHTTVAMGYRINLEGPTRLHRRSSIKRNLMNMSGTEATCFGVSLNIGSSSNNGLSVYDNDITVSGGVSTMGVSATSGVDRRQRIKVTKNNITNQNNDIGAGILFSQIRYSLIEKNTIVLSLNKPGIELLNGQGNRIKCNNVSKGSAGIRLVESPRNNVIGNTLTKNLVSMQINDNCKGTTGSYIARNYFNLGIDFSNLYNRDAETGAQTHTDYNEWLKQIHDDEPSDVEVKHLNELLVPVCYFSAPSGTNPGHVHFPYRDPKGMVDPTGTAPNLQDPCQSGGGGGGGGSEEHLIELMTPLEAAAGYAVTLADSAAMNGMTAAERANLESSIYLLVATHPEWRTSYPALDSFYQVHQAGWMGQVTDIYLLMDSLSRLQEEHALALEADYDQIESWTDAADSLQTLLSSTSDPVEQGQYTAELEVLYDQIATLEQSIELQTGLDDASDQILLQQIDASISSLSTPATPWDAEEYKMIGILNKALSGATLDPADYTDIDNIAHLCPEEYGSAVAIARGLSAGMMDTYVPLYECQDGQRRAALVEHFSHLRLRLVPNPAQDALRLQLTGGKDAFLSGYTVYNTRGQLLLNKKLTEDSRTHVLDTHTWDEGVYIIRVSTGDQVLSSRAVIVR